MNELQILLEWIGMGLAGLLIIVVVLMFGAIIRNSSRDQDWD